MFARRRIQSREMLGTNVASCETPVWREISARGLWRGPTFKSMIGQQKGTLISTMRNEGDGDET